MLSGDLQNAKFYTHDSVRYVMLVILLVMLVLLVANDFHAGIVGNVNIAGVVGRAGIVGNAGIVSNASNVGIADSECTVNELEM